MLVIETQRPKTARKHDTITNYNIVILCHNKLAQIIGLQDNYWLKTALICSHNSFHRLQYDVRNEFSP